MKKITALLLTVLLAVSLNACGGSGSAQQNSAATETQEAEEKQEEPAAAEEEAEAAATEENVEQDKTDEAGQETEAGPASQEPAAEGGHYSEPEAFAGFGEYTCGSREVVFGKTVFKEACGDMPIAETVQYKDGIPDTMASPETLEPGTFGLIVTEYFAKNGGQITYDIFNPSDAPIPYEDCVIIGVSSEDGMIFGNGIAYDSATPEAIMAILGDPYEINGTYSEEFTNAQFIWKDESGAHRLMLAYRAEGESREVSNLMYRDRSTGE